MDSFLLGKGVRGKYSKWHKYIRNCRTTYQSMCLAVPVAFSKQLKEEAKHWTNNMMKIQKGLVFILTNCKLALLNPVKWPSSALVWYSKLQ